MNKQLASVLKPLFERPHTSHKYDFGHMLVVGGAAGMVGAPFLSAQAALRTGAGLVTIASAEDVIDKLERRVEEVMTLRLLGDSAEALETLNGFITARKVNVLTIGPGLSPARHSLVRALLAKSSLPVVLDAGGLAAYDGRLAELHDVSRHNPDIILTPHPGEFARLIGKQLPGARAAVQKLLMATAQTTGTTIILKGQPTLIANAGGKTYTNHTGNPGLATAGTGDVLTGLITGLLAQGLGSFEAAACGVYLHGLAGDLAASVKTEPGLIASDVIEFIPAALQHVKTQFAVI